MGDTAKATAAPVTREINGKPVTIAPLGYRELGAFEAWAEIELEKTANAAGTPPENVLRGPKATKALIRTTRGRIEWAGRALRKATPGLTDEQLAELLPDAEAVMTVVEASIQQAFPKPPKGAKPKGEPF